MKAEDTTEGGLIFLEILLDIGEKTRLKEPEVCGAAVTYYCYWLMLCEVVGAGSQLPLV